MEGNPTMARGTGAALSYTSMRRASNQALLRRGHAAPRVWRNEARPAQSPEVTLRPEPASVSAARRWVRDVLNTRGYAQSCEVVALLTSELATNAVFHARTPFVVRIVLLDHRIRLEVEDGAPLRTALGSDVAIERGGRGFQLVAGLARKAGVEARADGKTVWCEVDDVDMRV